MLQFRDLFMIHLGYIGLYEPKKYCIMIKIGFLMFCSLIFFNSSCEIEEVANDVEAEDPAVNLIQLLTDDSRLSSKRPQPPIWADCIEYSGIVVPATFRPESDPFDELYAMPDATFKDGIPLISDSKPGDQDYNRGRWHMNVLKAGVDPAKYASACQAEDLDLSDFESTDNYFGCPLRPRKN